MDEEALDDEIETVGRSTNELKRRLEKLELEAQQAEQHARIVQERH